MKRAVITSAVFAVMLATACFAHEDAQASETAYCTPYTSDQSSETVIRIRETAPAERDETVNAQDSTPVPVEVQAVNETAEAAQTAEVQIPEQVPDTANVPAETQAPETPAHVHSYTGTVTVPATCTADGVKTYTCSCGSSYTETVPATGHDYILSGSAEPGCETNGSADYTCTVCGDVRSEIIPATGHEWTLQLEIVYVVDQPAWDETFENRRDEEHWYCNVCGWDMTADGYSPLSPEFEEHEWAHMIALEGGGYHNGLVPVPFIDTVHHEEKGHNELRRSNVCSKCGAVQFISQS